MKKFKPISEMNTAELKDWKQWAQDEIMEYQDFIEEINEALNNK